MWIPGHPDALDVFNVVFLILILTVGVGALGYSLVAIIRTHPRKLD